MSNARPFNAFAVLSVALALAASLSTDQPRAHADDSQPPKQGDRAPEFDLKTVAGQPLRLSKLLEEGPVVLLVLRGYPGYQCPLCSRQVGQYLAQAAKFKAAGRRVVIVYPGPSQDLQDKAQEFIAGQTLPPHFELAIDPDYTFTTAYRLRWDAKNETAYPSTFVIGKDGKTQFAKISRTHGDRTTPDEILKILAAN